jgi:hypothetical protein
MAETNNKPSGGLMESSFVQKGTRTRMASINNSSEWIKTKTELKALDPAKALNPVESKKEFSLRAILDRLELERTDAPEAEAEA